MNINLIWDASVSSAPDPSEFEAAVTDAANVLDGLLTDPITANILVGWGEDDNGTYSVTGGEAVGGPLGGVDLTYAKLKADLAAAYGRSGSTADATALANLPSDPFGGAEIYVSSAQEKAWGLLPSTGTEVDGAIGFNPSFTFAYDPANRAVPGEVDLIGVAEHELTHALGRTASYPTGSVGGGGESYTVMDLFRYSAAGQLASYGGQPAYFSIDGGVSGQNYPYDTVSDIADWAETISGDSFGYGDYGQVLQISPTDLTEMNVLGFDIGSASGSGAGQLAVWDMNGTSVIGGGLVSPNPGPSWRAVGTGDFSDDGHSDILWQNTSGQVAIWDMNGTSLTGGGVVSPNPGPSWKAVGTGDFNDDGHSDILWQNTDGQAAIWEMNGTNLIGGGNVGPDPGSTWKEVGTGDFNDDGFSDIVWQNANGQVAIWELNGTTTIPGGSQILPANPGPGWQAIGTGDFNNDGHSDILFQNAASGQVAIWDMNGTSIIGGGAVSANPGPAWRAVGTGDFNGAGDSGILFQNTASGQVAIWDMDGTAIVGGGAVSAIPGPAWRAIGTGGGAILFQNTGNQTLV